MTKQLTVKVKRTVTSTNDQLSGTTEEAGVAPEQV